MLFLCIKNIEFYAEILFFIKIRSLKILGALVYNKNMKKFFHEKADCKHNLLQVRVITIILSIVTFVIIAYLVDIGCVDRFDLSIGATVRALRNNVTDIIFVAVTYAGNWQFVVSIALLLFIMPKTREDYGKPLAAASIGSVVVYKLLKGVFKRPRPDIYLHIINQDGWSFPSGHAMNCMVFYGLLIYLLRCRLNQDKTRTIWTVALSILIFTIGFSRVFVGVHYPTDIIGGWTAGFAILMTAVIIIDKTNEIKIGN